MTMPHRGRPVYQYFVTQGGGHTSEGIRERLLQLEGVRDVLVHFTWEPAWTTERLTDAGRRSLGLE
jgi:metal-sulfur cluster biosynthetic enzyme